MKFVGLKHLKTNKLARESELGRRSPVPPSDTHRPVGLHSLKLTLRNLMASVQIPLLPFIISLSEL